MQIPKKILNGLQCVLCGAENNISLMRFCDKTNKLFKSLISELSLQEIKDCEKLYQIGILSKVCTQCYKEIEAIYEFGVRSLLSSHTLRMKFLPSNIEKQTSSSAGESWLKIVDVISQNNSDVSTTSSSPQRKSTRKRPVQHTTNGVSELLHNKIKKDSCDASTSEDKRNSEINGGGPKTTNGFRMSTRSTRRSRASDLDDKSNRKSDNETLDEIDNTSKSSKVSSLNHNLNMGKWYSPNGSCTSDNIEIENILNHNDMLEVHENEILQINFNNTPSTRSHTQSSPITKSSLSDRKTKVLRSGVELSKIVNASYNDTDSFPMMPENHPPLLEVLYEAPVESALETESGGRVDKQNDKITSASRKKSSTCAFCHKCFKTQLLLNRHLVSTHIHDKRRAIKEHREQKAVDKLHVCSTCHSSFRSEYMLEKHQKSHKRFCCEVCDAEYANPMDFTWHVAKCSGANRSLNDDKSVWTRSRSRQSSTPGPLSSLNEIDIDYNDNVSVLDTEKTVLSGIMENEHKLSDISKQELEKWVEETKKVQTIKHKRKVKKKKASATRGKGNEKVDDCDEEVANLNYSSESRNSRAPTPFPSRRSSMSSLADSSVSSRAATPYSQISENNMENWDRFTSEIEDFDDAGSVASGFTAVSTADSTDIESRLSFNCGSSIGSRNKSRDSILTDISTLSTRPRTRNVTKAIQQLELELRSTTAESTRSSLSRTSESYSESYRRRRTSFNRSQRSTSHSRLSSSHRRRSRRSFKLQYDGFNALIYECMEISCSGKFTNLDDLMEHEEQAHKLLKLFFCQECKKKFTCRKYLEKHLLTHEPESNICSYCDNNPNYVKEFKTHFEMHQHQSSPCRQEGCFKRFLKPFDFIQHKLSFNERHITNKQEKDFVRQCLKQRAVEQGLEYLNNKIVKRRIRRTSSDSSVDIGTQRTFANILNEMHAQGTHINLTKMTPGAIPSLYDYETTRFVPISTEEKTEENQSSSNNVDFGVCDTILNGDIELYHLKVIPTPSEAFSGNEVSSSFDETTESEIDQVSLKNLSTRRKRKKVKINLSSKKNRGRQVIALRYFERDLSLYSLPSYSDIKYQESQFEHCLTIDNSAKPWRICL